MTNFLNDLTVLINKIRKEGNNNLLSSVYFGMRAAGAQDMIDRLPYLKASEFMSVLRLKKYIGINYYMKAEKSFLKSPEGIAPVSDEEKLKIVLAVGLNYMYKLFDDSYFTGRGELGIDHINNIFRLATLDQRIHSLAQGLMAYFGQKSSKKHWTDENAEILEFLAQTFVSKLKIYDSSVDKELANYLVDTYGLNIAFNKLAGTGPCIYDDENFADIVGYASKGSFSSFLANYSVSGSPRMETIETLLFLRNNMDSLLVMVDTIGCKNADVERHLLFQGTLPLGSVRQGLCFPQNLEKLISVYGADCVSKVFPKSYKHIYPCLWEWVRTGLKPEKFTEMNDCERKYLLGSATLCRQYMSEGGVFSREDIATLLRFGQDEIIAEYNSK